MKRVLVLALALFVAPMAVSAQVEVGLDAGVGVNSYDSEFVDNVTSFDIPGQWVRVAFAAGEMMLVESAVGLTYESQGDESFTTLLLLPGVNFLLGEQFYVRGEAGLLRLSDGDNSATQYAFGGAAGLRMPLGDGAALLRLEAGVDKWLENLDDGLLGFWQIRAGAGISAVIN